MKIIGMEQLITRERAVGVGCCWYFGGKFAICNMLEKRIQVPVILATWEAETEWIMVLGSPDKKFIRLQSSKWTGGVAQASSS
jgi:hypothetical protein